MLDLMSIPGLLPPLPTGYSEYLVTFLIMIITIVTGTLDITTPYNTDNSMVGVTLFLAQFTQLMGRLVVFGSILSMEKENERTSVGLLVVVAFFVGSYLATCVWYWVCNRLELFHRGGTKYQRRIASSADEDVANGDTDGSVPWSGMDVLNMQRASRFELCLLRTMDFNRILTSFYRSDSPLILGS
eukprot:COSAG06_NODE_3434_length_5354_cov_5.834063_2_plen_186_part_00